MTTKSFSNRKVLTIRTINRKIALYVRIKICMPWKVGMQNEFLDFVSLQIQRIIVSFFRRGS